MFVFDFFVNICICITFLFVYTLFTKKYPLTSTSSTKRLIMSGIVYGLLGNILMYFSIQVNETTIIDMRNIPIIISYLFAGWLPSLISAILIILGRFIYGINSSSLNTIYIISTMYMSYTLISIFIKDKFKRLLLMLVSTNLIFITYLLLIFKDSQLALKIIPFFIISTFITGIIGFLLKDYLRTTQELFKRYENEVKTDYLTNIGNFRYFDEKLNELRNLDDFEKNISLLMLDIDYFKKINDRFGHDVGDEILVEMAKRFEDVTKSENCSVYRRGGEEFCILLVDTTLPKAIQIAEKVRKEIEINKFKLKNSQEVQVTISIGIAHYPTIEMDLLTKKADQLLYLAKENGRNRVEYIV